MKRLEKLLAVSLEILAGATCTVSGFLMNQDDVFVLLPIPAAVLSGSGLVLWSRAAKPALTPPAEPKQVLDESTSLQQEVAALQADVIALREEREFLAQLYAGKDSVANTKPQVLGGP